jgi:lipopolysaccharide biosynthesis regulator YciM
LINSPVWVTKSQGAFWLSELNDLLEGSLAEEEPRRLSLQPFLTVAYRDNGQVGKAIKLLKHIVTLQEKSLAEEHPQRLTALQALAVAYQDNSQVDKATKLLKHVVTL